MPDTGKWDIDQPKLNSPNKSEKCRIKAEWSIMKNIATKLLILMGIATALFSVFLFYRAYALTNQRVMAVVEQQASMALKFDLAIREYIGENVRPVMYELLGPDAFIPETMSTSYVARIIFEDVRKEFPDYIIKFSSDNPRNPVNQAGPEELKIIEYLNNNPQLERWEGAISINGKPYVAKFSAMRMAESCMHCHGKPEDAPAALLKKYGSTAGFYRPLGKIIGLDTVAIPMARISEKLRSESLKNFFISAFGLLLFFMAIVFSTRFVITNRLTMISRHLKKAAQQKDCSNIDPIKIKGKDEIFDLAFSFNTLIGRLKKYYRSLETQVKERTRALVDTNEQMKQEIVERKQAEEALRESEGKYRTIFENIQDVYYVTNIDGSILEISPSVETAYQYSRNALIGKSLSDIYTNPEERDALLKLLLDKGKVNDFEIYLTDKDGFQHLCSISTLLIRDEQGNPTKIIGSIRDISERERADNERKLLEAQLQQSQKMEAIGTLAGGVAHDFNNLLTVITGNAQLALMQISKDNPLKEYIEDIRNAGDNAASLTRQLLAFSRKQVIQPKVLSLNEALDDMEKMLRRLIREDIELAIDLAPELWPVNIDPGQIEQVLMNLVVNAKDAMPKGGKLTVQTANVNLDLNYFKRHGVKEQPGSYVMLKVTDTGMGMDVETRVRIFEPFFTTKELGRGTGLGLSSVYGIAKQNKGYVSVYSEPGKGATFKVYFPKIDTDAVSDIEEQVDDHLLKGSETILVVEDNQVLLKMTQKMLEKYGYRILTAQNGREALAVFTGYDGPIHLILTDVVMPEMGGRELAEKIKSEKPEVKVIFMSGYSDNAVSDNGTLHKDVKFIKKPFSPGGLASKVREVLNKEQD